MMKLQWYLNRLCKMTPDEIWKRLNEEVMSAFQSIKYERHAPLYEEIGRNYKIRLNNLPFGPIDRDVHHFSIYGEKIDLTRPVDWHRAQNGQWPNVFYKKINYRPGNPHGDIRFNWELNRLQFLPLLAVKNKNLAVSLLEDWLEKNPYLIGPAYVSAMEVALRWMSVYRAICLMGNVDASLECKVTGLAVVSGNILHSRLSTHSSAGNHLMLEALGLFWLGSALSDFQTGKKWMMAGRKILWHETLRQLNADGTNGEQTFWYLGFVLDALLHYLLLENREVVPAEVTDRIVKSFEYLVAAVLPNGAFPDYGDRDDGCVFRASPDYDESYFCALLDTAAWMFDRPDWMDRRESTSVRKYFFRNRMESDCRGGSHDRAGVIDKLSKASQLDNYPCGGITIMKSGRGCLFFKHGPLGMAPLYGHGHADVLSFSFFWNNVPVFVDPGCGQYSGDKTWRDYFRSTPAHNTICVNNANQAETLGPFLWKKSYRTALVRMQQSPYLMAEASHDGYKDRFGVMHTRSIAWPEETGIEISDILSGTRTFNAEGALHIQCNHLFDGHDGIDAAFNGFSVRMIFEPKMQYRVIRGSKSPFAGWISPLYGVTKPIYSVFYTLPAAGEAKVHIQIRKMRDESIE